MAEDFRPFSLNMNVEEAEVLRKKLRDASDWAWAKTVGKSFTDEAKAEAKVRSELFERLADELKVQM